MKKWFLLFFLFSNFAFASGGLESLPIQDGGRLKPYDTFAREALQLVYGRQKYNKRPASEVVFTWMLVPEYWEDVEFVQIRHSGLREALQLHPTKIYYKIKDLMVNERVGLVFSELRTRRDNEEKLNPYFQAVQTLEHQITMFHAVRIGEGMKLVPAKEGDNWVSVAKLEEPYKGSFQEITKAFAGLAEAQSTDGDVNAAKNTVDEKVDNFKALLVKDFGDSYANLTRINTELHYNNFHPFMYAWIAYLIGVIFMIAAWVGTKPVYSKVAWVFYFIGLGLHTYGFGLRSYIIERAPVTNMYETVVWVAWGAIVIAMILEKIYRTKVTMVAAGIAAILCLILTDLSAQVLDSTLSPLEPVLRDNFWLLTHVLIITLSYAAFFIAFFIGDLLMFYYLKDEKKYAKQITDGANAIYRSIQIGVVLLAAGTILGGIWADYSWGRFWGWDPKETWAFIALMGYLAILHGRLAGWLKNFGLAMTSVVAFSLVIMAWYGVNFVLGAGLHTYGFGAGGVEYVSAFVAVHLLAVIYVTTVRQSRLKTQ